MTTSGTADMVDQRPPVGSALRTAAKFHRHEELLGSPVPGGDRDTWSIDAVLDLLPTLPSWPQGPQRARGTSIRWGARVVLEWLSGHPGGGWQDRWLRSGADDGAGWIDGLVARTEGLHREFVVGGLVRLLLCRIVMPSYEFLTDFGSVALLRSARKVFRPDLFAVLEGHADGLDVGSRRLGFALKVTAKIVLHTGRDLDRLTAEDVLAFRASSIRARGIPDPGVALAWTLLRQVTDLGPHLTLREVLRVGQRPTAELVDAYRIKSRAIREVLIRYLDERRASVDYSSLIVLVGQLVGRFWADIEHHHAGIDSLDLSDAVVESWRQRLATVVNPDGSTRPRAAYYDILIVVRSFYKDIHEWAQEDPWWAPWAVRIPIRRSDAAGQGKVAKQRRAAIHQRTRERLPHLHVLVDTAERNKTEHAELLAAAAAAEVGAAFTHAGHRYRRTVPKVYAKRSHRHQTPRTLLVDLDTGETIDAGRNEQQAFMTWAVIEVLRHTGVRIEELLEITHLGMVAYQLPDTGETVPMLQIVPSKTNEERLLLIL